MRALLVGFVLASVCLVSAVQDATAADVSDQMLAAMGAGGMQKISDAQGEQIRGKGFVMAWQNSSTYTLTTGTDNSQGFISTSRRGSPRVANLRQRNESGADIDIQIRTRRGGANISSSSFATSSQSLRWGR